VVNPPSPGRIVQSWLLVVAAVALGLQAADHLPPLLSGTPHGVRVYASAAEAERALDARIWLPAFYPDTLQWPPARIVAWPGPPAMVALHVNARGSRREILVLVQSIGTPATPPDVLLPAAEVLTTADVVVGGRPAVVTRAVAPDGEVVHDVRWDHGDRRIVMRYRGPVEDLLLIAESLERTRS
jgi:hypothetical protein